MGGVISITGKPIENGVFNYSIPLTGGCGIVFATGTLTVIGTPHPITSVSAVNPSAPGSPSVITIRGSNFIPGQSYTIIYDADGANPATNVSRAVIAAADGSLTFNTASLTAEGVSLLTVKSIVRTGDPCPYIPSGSNTALFGIVCTVPFPNPANPTQLNGTFYVPEGVFEVTVETWGGGGKGSTQNSNGYGGGGGGGAYSKSLISVTAGEAIAVSVGGGSTTTVKGGDSWVSRTNNSSDAIVLAVGGNSVANNTTTGAAGGSAAVGKGQFKFNGGNGATSTTSLTGGGGSSAGISNPGNNGSGSNGGVSPTGGGSGGNGWTGASNSQGGGVSGNSPGGGGGGARRRNSGTQSGGSGANGKVVITYICPAIPCGTIVNDGATTGYTVIQFNDNCLWTAPEGLDELQVMLVGGGGGGGMGSSAGGGGGAIITSQVYSGITIGGSLGFPAGTSFNPIAGIAGPGATSTTTTGGNGGTSTFSGPAFTHSTGIFSALSASGGGWGGSSGSLGVLSGNLGGSGGGGGAFQTSPISGESGVGGTATAGNNGGNGLFSNPGNNNGFETLAGGGGGGAGGVGSNGGRANPMSANPRAIGGNGGNGFASNFSGTNFIYSGGGGGTSIGGVAGNQSPVPGLGGNSGATGGNAQNISAGNPGVTIGSGGGAGGLGGGNGARGVVYVRYPNFRILPVEYLYFNATYNTNERSGELNWATANEWESSHFEIERSVNDPRNWKKVGEIKSQGYSDSASEYSFTDTNLPASGGNIFYRLKQVDLGGDFGYSVTKAIQVEALDGSTSWIVYPNPSAMGSMVNVELLDKSGFTDGNIDIRISDARGISYTYSVSSSEEVTDTVNSYLIQARPGLHILQIFWGDRSEVIKLIRR